MTLSELRYLVAVADLRHFGHAAERCHITQSTLSTQLRKLEDFLGVTLFERTSRPIAVTPIGESIVLRARRIIEEADQICDLARQDEGLLSSTLKLGIIPTATEPVFVAIVPRSAAPRAPATAHPATRGSDREPGRGPAGLRSRRPDAGAAGRRAGPARHAVVRRAVLVCLPGRRSDRRTQCHHRAGSARSQAAAAGGGALSA